MTNFTVDLSKQVKELQERLDRRNRLLDSIRKSYHRDVLVVKEYLLKLKEKGNIPELETIFFIDGQEIDLKSIPSIDLKNQGLHLYAPEECELRLMPCFQCGGRLEVIHRESTRYMTLKGECDGLKNDVANLESKLTDRKKQLETMENNLTNADVRERLERQRCSSLTEELKQKIIESEKLKEKCDEKNEEIDKLLKIQGEKIELERELCKTKRNLTKSQEASKTILLRTEIVDSEAKELKNEIKAGHERRERLERDIANLHGIREKNDRIIIENEMNIDKLNAMNEERCKEISRLESELSVSRNEINEMKCQFKEAATRYERTIQGWESRNLISKEKIANLEREILLKVDEDKEYRQKVKLDIDSYNEAEEKRTVQYAAEKDMITDKLNVLDSLTSSYIRGLYDHCLAQDEILDIESKERKTKNPSKNGIQSNKLSYVFERLENKSESMHIDWDEILGNENDRRQIYGKLNNRAERNLSDISKLINRMRSRHGAIMKKSQDKCDQKLLNQRSSYESHLTGLRKSVQEKETALSEITSCFKASQETLKGTEIDLGRWKKRSKLCEEEMMMKKEEIESIEKEKIAALHELEQKSQIVIYASEEIKTLKEDVEDRDQTLSELQSLLENVANKYSKVIEKERYKTETNQNVEIQVSTSFTDFAQQVNFVQNAGHSTTMRAEKMKARQANNLPTTNAILFEY